MKSCQMSDERRAISRSIEMGRRATLTTLAALGMVAAICMIAVSLGDGSSRAELLGPAVGGKKVVAGRAAAARGDSKESFKGEWAQWLSHVTTQVQAAEDVSSSLTSSKLAKLGGLLRKDLADDAKMEPGMQAAAAETPKALQMPKRAMAVMKKRSAPKPFSDAIAKDDASITAAKKEVLNAERALAFQEQQGAGVKHAAAAAAVNTAGSKQASSVAHGKKTVAVAAAHAAHRAAAAKAAPQKTRATTKAAAPSKESKKKPHHDFAEMERHMLAAAMQGALKAGLMGGPHAKAEERKETKSEEAGWSKDLSKWGLP